MGKDPNYHAEYYKVNKERFKQISSSNYARRKQESPMTEWAKKIFTTIKQRAKAKNIPFDVPNYQYLLDNLPKKCPVFGAEFVFFDPKKRDLAPSVDRKDNTKGYTMDNIHIISVRANNIKSKYNSYEIQQVANWLKQLGY